MNREQFQAAVKTRIEAKAHYQENKQRIDDLHRAQTEAVRALSTWNIMQTAEIASQTDDNGKPVFSNQEKRNAELLTRQMSSGEFADLEKAVETCNIEMSKAIYENTLLAIGIEGQEALIDYELSHADIEDATEKAVRRFFAARL